ncbi:hypothetical protein Thit_0400 [Thermoanaerobacter italicus Ab9]|uniref:DUF4097 domain-containing protein n=2 Tax=Thermoanaerobacter TaxID=1754 RepID=D3T6U4_THEIA|nr:hypothetical protein Thit_0400 [Thermoanaerobacter italicus Ab9]
MRFFPVVLLFILILIIFTACNGGNWMSYHVKETKQISKQLSGIEKIKIYNGVGEIICIPSNDSEVKVYITKKVSGQDKSYAQDVCNRISFSFSVENSTLSINAKIDDKEFWKWKSDNYKGDISIDYRIEIPKEIKNVTCETGVGDIEVKDIRARFYLKTGVGEIKVSGIEPMLNSKIESGIGDVKAKLANIENVTELYVKSDLGDINLSIPKNSKCKIDAVVNNHKCDFESDNNAKVVVTVRTGLGDIKLNKF